MNTVNNINSEFKLKHFGEGEWVNEIDLHQFKHKGYECKVLRVVLLEPYVKEECYFGGHLCGYVAIPESHPYFSLKYQDMEMDCHGGLTYGDRDLNGKYEIGFDCAHYNDIIPSMDYLYKTDPSLKKMTEELKMISYSKYRNMDFCVTECMAIVDQLIEIQKVSNGNF